MSLFYQSIHQIITLYVGGLLLGDEKMINIISELNGSRIDSLVLTNNSLTDFCLPILAKTLRSLHCLSDLHLNNNDFSDSGMQDLFHRDNYSPSLRLLNAACLRISCRTSYVVGCMFSEGNLSQVIISLKIHLECNLFL